MKPVVIHQGRPWSFRERWHRTEDEERSGVIFLIITFLASAFCLTFPFWDYTGLGFEIFDYVVSPLAILICAFGIPSSLGYFDQNLIWGESEITFYRTAQTERGRVWVAADGAGWIPGAWRYKWLARRGVRRYYEEIG